MGTSSRPLRKVSLETQQRPILKKKMTSPVIPTPGLLGGFREISREVVEQAKPESTSFLQYCAMCEKQIMTPCGNILYCSEACRRRDGCKPLSAANLSDLTPPSSAPSSPPKHIARALSSSYIDLSSARIPPRQHHFKSDLDPTEWKPKLHGQRRMQSEAFHYLSRFHRSAMGDSEDGKLDAKNASELPALDGTAASLPVPSLTTSLLGTPATIASETGGSSLRIGIGGGMSIDGTHELGYAHTYTGSYDFSTRPLLPRHNRWYSVSGATPKGTDLVTPHIAPPVIRETFNGETFDEETGEDLWGKKLVLRSPSSKGNMGALFGRK